MSGSSALVIIGASYAGTQLAASVRELGFDAPIVLVGEEPYAPYQRPPLSKGLLTGKSSVESLALRGADFFKNQSIDLRLCSRATSLNLDRQTVQLDDGVEIAYGSLVLATGARCRTLPVPGSDLKGVFNLRTLNDALKVSDALDKATRACVIGGGFIGLEVASALAARGASVTVVESQARLLARSFPPLMSDYLADAHRRRGVTLVLGQNVRALHGQGGEVHRVELEDGSAIECDMVVLGIGVEPNVELAQSAGIACENGILTDALGRTSAPHVYAVGDVANTLLPVVPGGPTRMRLESIQAANDGARATASAIAGQAQAFDGVPWFWSDQHNLKIQMAGLPVAGDEVVIRGDMASDRFSLFYLRDGAIVAAQSVNRPAEHMLSRKLIARRARIDSALLQDDSVDLKSLPA